MKQQIKYKLEYKKCMLFSNQKKSSILHSLSNIIKSNNHYHDIIIELSNECNNLLPDTIDDYVIVDQVDPKLISKLIQVSIKTNTTFTKIGFDKSSEDKGLEVERKLYSNVLNKLSNHTPLLLTHSIILYNKCNFTIPHGVKKIIGLQLPIAGKFEFGEIIESLDDSHILKILYELLWLCECFNKIGLRHNDLHLNNIYYTATEPYCIQYGKIKFIKDYNLKVIDFDRSSKCATDIDKYECINDFIIEQEFDVNYGTSNKYNPKFDTYKILWGILNMKISDQIKTHIKNMCSNDEYLYKYFNSGFLFDIDTNQEVFTVNINSTQFMLSYLENYVSESLSQEPTRIYKLLS